MPGVWTDLSAATPARAWYMGDYDPGLDLIIGHLQSFGHDTGGFNGTSWSDITTSTTATPFTEHVMAYDGVGVIQFGSFELGVGPISPETWRFSSGNWHHLSPGTVPGAADSCGGCPVPGGVLIFGGTDFTGVPYSGETWFWDQSNWNLITSPDSPSSRIVPQMCHIPGYGVVLFGGDDGVTTQLGDTWFFDLDTMEWTDITSGLDISPDPRSQGGFAYNGTAAAMFGGVQAEAGTPIAETWTFSPSSGWAQCDVPHPGERDQFGMVYDSLRERAVIWSGDKGGGLAQTDTWSFTGTCGVPSTSVSYSIRATVGL